MTTDEIYEIAQKAKGECVTLGWFEDNNPCKENWREEVCYYVNHTVDEVEVFWYRKEDGRIIHNIKIVKNGDFDEIQSKKINLSWIRKVNGNPVDMKFMNFKNEWGIEMFDLKINVENYKKHRVSSNFVYEWESIFRTMLRVRDRERVRLEHQYIHRKSFDKIFQDLEIIFKSYYEHYKNEKIKNKNRIQLFQFLHNLFLTEDVKNVKISLS